MAILQVRHSPEPILRQRTRWIKDLDSSLQKLIDDMIETMGAEYGVGLAANQVGVPLRLAVVQLPEDEDATVLINPEIVRSKGEREIDEGCLSMPGYRGRVRRSQKVRAKALDRHGKVLRIRAENDLMAQVLEHEIDHLNGTLYSDHLVGNQLWPVAAEGGEDQDNVTPATKVSK